MIEVSKSILKVLDALSKNSSSMLSVEGQTKDLERIISQNGLYKDISTGHQIRMLKAFSFIADSHN